MIAIVAFMAPTAAQVLADVQKHYAKLPQLTMDFDQKVTSVTFGRTTASHGTMYLEKPNLFRADYIKVVNGKTKFDKQFIYDGQQFWIVDHMNLTVIVTSVNTSVIPSVGAFLTNSNLAASYDVSLAHGKLVLKPKQPQADVKELDFVIDANNNVTESIVIAPSGDANDFTFTKTTSGLIPPGTFVFDPKSVPTYKVISPPAAPAPAKPAAPAKAPTPAPAKPGTPVFLDPTVPTTPTAPTTPPASITP